MIPDQTPLPTSTAVTVWNPRGVANINKSMDLEYLRKLFRYDAWANRESLGSVRAAAAPARALKLMSHIVAAERLWLARLEQQKPPVPVWPEFSLEECERQLEPASAAWSEYLDRLTATRIPVSVAYTNSKGERWSNAVQDILMHVVMHSAYHRGQIAADIRAAGFTPAYTDFIEAVRRKEI